FVTELDSTGSGLVYSTFLGGGADRGTAIAVDASGSAYVTGVTGSSNFPTTPTAFQTTANRPVFVDAFVIKLSPTGSSPIYSTLLGGNSSDIITGIAVDLSGNAYVTGETFSNDFPTTPGALQSVNLNSTLFKSTDAGTTWSAIRTGPSSSQVTQVDFDPLDASVVYAAGGGSLFKSTDR